MIDNKVLGISQHTLLSPTFNTEKTEKEFLSKSTNPNIEITNADCSVISSGNGSNDYKSAPIVEATDSLHGQTQERNIGKNAETNSETSELNSAGDYFNQDTTHLDRVKKR